MGTPEHSYTIRPFLPDEIALYKSIRLEALQTEAGMFGSSYAREIAFTDAQWLERIVNPNAACLGLFCDDELIGITGIMTDRGEPGLAHMTQSYIRKSYRGNGLSRILYQTRIDWARERKLSRVAVSHRAGNAAAIAANQHFGFMYTHGEPHTWPDGGMDSILHYELKL